MSNVKQFPPPPPPEFPPNVVVRSGNPFSTSGKYKVRANDTLGDKLFNAVDDFMDTAGVGGMYAVMALTAIFLFPFMLPFWCLAKIVKLFSKGKK